MIPTNPDQPDHLDRRNRAQKKQNSWSALILSGGRSSRLGADKASLVLDPGSGLTQLQRTMEAAASAGAERITVVGETPPATSNIEWLAHIPHQFVLEADRFSGPVAALTAGSHLVTTDWVLILPVDLVDPDQAVQQLLAAWHTTGGTGSGWIGVDQTGHRQYLCALVPTSTLHDSFNTTTTTTPTATSTALPGTSRSPSMRAVMEGWGLEEVPGRWDDVDTVADLKQARTHLLAPQEGNTTMTHAESDQSEAPIPGLHTWLRQVADELSLPHQLVETGPLLRLTRDVARRVVRPGAPTSTYLLGISVGLALSGVSPQDLTHRDDLTVARQHLDTLIPRVQELVAQHEAAVNREPTPQSQQVQQVQQIQHTEQTQENEEG